MFCRKSDFLHVGGFDECLPIMEDADLCIRMHEAGPVSLNVPTAASAPTESLAFHQEDRSARTTATDNSGYLNAPSSLPAGQEKTRQKQRRCRGTIHLVWKPTAATSGRRLAAWGNLKATWIHFQLGLRWYMGASPEQMQELYRAMYTDAFR